jgi:hypothetical protein
MAIFDFKEKCTECGKECKNKEQLEIHMEWNHPTIPKPPDPNNPEVKELKTTMETFSLEPEDLAKKLAVGDIFTHERKVLVRKITKTKDRTIVEGEIIKRAWSPNK